MHPLARTLVPLAFALALLVAPGSASAQKVTTFYEGTPGNGDLVVDGAGNVYLSNSGANTITKITPDGVGTPFAGVVNANGMAFGPTGDLFVTADEFKAIYRITPGGIVSPFVKGIPAAARLAFNASGMLYFADYYGQAVYKATPAGVVSLLVAGVNPPGSRAASLAVDAAGDVYCGTTYGGTISRISPSGVVTPFASGLGGGLDDLVSRPGGEFYVVSYGANNVYRLDRGGSSRLYAGTGVATSVDGPLATASFDGPHAIAFAQPWIYVLDYRSGKVRRIGELPRATSSGRRKGDRR